MNKDDQRKAIAEACPDLFIWNADSRHVIGWHGPGNSILVECKVSRADFLADKAKCFRRYEDMGMGDDRYYAAPAGIVKPEDLPEGWGLLVIHESRIRVEVEPKCKKADKRAEVKMLMSSIRRLELSTAVFVRHDLLEPDNQHP